MPKRADPVKGVLAEELSNAVRRLGMYAQAIRSLPRGSMVSRSIKGRKYFYIAFWKDGKVRYEYKGRVAPEEYRRYVEASAKKARYRKLMADLRARIVFIRRALHERKRRPV